MVVGSRRSVRVFALTSSMAPLHISVLAFPLPDAGCVRTSSATPSAAPHLWRGVALADFFLAMFTIRPGRGALVLIGVNTLTLSLTTSTGYWPNTPRSADSTALPITHRRLPAKRFAATARLLIAMACECSSASVASSCIAATSVLRVSLSNSRIAASDARS
jgi:hypothetical protein